tara:strand:- start:2097 stop:2486 length:390 start_codon:yes stop_codon:yes gene_type:complete
MLDIGKFDRQILIQEGVTTTDTMGGVSYEWGDETEFNDWAFVEWKSGKSDDDQDKIQSVMSVEFTIRNVSTNQQSVTANRWRIVFPVAIGSTTPFENQYYTITGVTIWGGREKYKTLITELNTNEFPIK